MKKVLGFGVMILLSALPAWAECPSADLTGDCFVDLSDFAVLAGHWLTEDPAKENQDLAMLASQWLTGNRLPSDMVVIPGGTFQMGSQKGYVDELPIHTVTLDSFAMGKFEITNRQYCAFLNSAYPSQLKMDYGMVFASSDTNNSFPFCNVAISYAQIIFINNTFIVLGNSGKDRFDYPMFCVSWYGAAAYCNWQSQREGKEMCYDLSTWGCDFTKKGYRLATEAEWEFAARGGLSGNRFPWGDTITHDDANYYSDSRYYYDVSPTRSYHPVWSTGMGPYTSPVGSFAPNGYGLYDMAGNVWEWCQDWYGPYISDVQTNPTGPTTGIGRIIRGGSWQRSAYYCRVSYRNFYTYPDSWGSPLGFRVVLKP